MEKNNATIFCKNRLINYLGLAQWLMYFDYCAEVSVLLYSALNMSQAARWGRVFYACLESGCFHPMEVSNFRDMLAVLFSEDCPGMTTLKEGIGQVTLAFQRAGKKNDNDKYAKYRKEVMELTQAIRKACHIEPENPD